MPSIKQNQPAPTGAATPPSGTTGVALPNFCNLGIMLRILFIVDGMSVVAATLKAPTYDGMWQELMSLSALVQPVLLLSLLALCLGRGLLSRLPYHFGVAAVLLLELALSTLVHTLSQRLFDADLGSLERHWLFVVLVSGVLLGYFHLRSRAFSPAFSEARLQALQARIRPHFLFKQHQRGAKFDPFRSETGRAGAGGHGRPVSRADGRQSPVGPLTKEVALCRQYLELEHLRLGND